MIIASHSSMLLAIGADHRGFEHKNALMRCNSIDDGHITLVWYDVGAYTSERSDYPQFAQCATQLVVGKKVEGAVLLCGTGIGMAIAANRTPGVYAGVVWSADVARSAREDDNVNILVIPADYLSLEETQQCLMAWLTASFRGGRYAQRLQQIDR